MKIGYLHLGPPEHGVCRYGHMLADTAKQQNLDVIEVNLTLTNDRNHNQNVLREAAKTLSKADIVHFQFSKRLWGSRLRLYYIWLFAQNCSSPLVATLHDIYLNPVQLNIHQLTTYIKSKYGQEALFFRFLMSQVRQVFVCTEQEAKRLNFIADSKLSRSKITVIPHFVEERKTEISAEAARKALNLEAGKVITLLGWIHPRKGHQLVVEAMANLPDDVKVVFAGRPSSNKGAEMFAQSLVECAEKLGVSERLRITGYLSEEELEQYLLATDVAVCPFISCSASGSLSTWISVAHPKILAFDLPQIQEYNRLVPGAIQTFASYTPIALAQAIQNLLDAPGEAHHSAIHTLRSKLHISTVLDRHLDQYCQTISPRLIPDHSRT